MTSPEKQTEAQRNSEDAAYVAWLRANAKTLADIFKRLDPYRIQNLIRRYETYRDRPVSLYASLSDAEERAIKKHAGTERLTKIIMVKTDPFIFAPSIVTPADASLDLGTAIFRRFFIHGSWVSVIALNETFLTAASESMLRYVLEHELAQGEIYTEMAEYKLQNLSPDMRGVVHEEARMKAIKRSGISEDEVEQERQLIIELSGRHPVVPVHFASAALVTYLRANWAQLQQFGAVSQTEMERELEGPTASLLDRVERAIELYGVFLRALKRELTMTGAEYGVAVV
ncbi:MAG: hypothetical protein JW945_04505 [Methanomicrobia archaeon]|nr:hypothetical protein [Methanomicrobia archaeon]